MDSIKENVAKGLRRMKIVPDYFLWTGENSWDSEVLGIPVVHSALVMNTFSENGVPFIPLWKTENEQKYFIERKRFEDGYVD